MEILTQIFMSTLMPALDTAGSGTAADAAAALPDGLMNLLPWGGLAAALALITGWGELITRYRDEPLNALLGSYGIAYALANMAVSVGLFSLLIHQHDSMFRQLSIVWISFLAGLGAMAILRSKIFTFQTKTGEDVPIGPDGIVKAYLDWTDRGVDRRQSDIRWGLAQKYLSDIADEPTFKSLLGYLGTNLRSYQHLSNAELTDFTAAVNNLTTGDTAISFGLRSVTAGLAFQELAGSDNFEKIAVTFRQSSGLPPI